LTLKARLNIAMNTLNTHSQTYPLIAYQYNVTDTIHGKHITGMLTPELRKVINEDRIKKNSQIDMTMFYVKYVKSNW
jgi:hypothetical protein